MKKLKLLFIAVLFSFTPVLMYSSSSEINTNTESDYLIFFHCDGSISIYDNGDKDCFKFFGQNGDGSFNLVYSVGC